MADHPDGIVGEVRDLRAKVERLTQEIATIGESRRCAWKAIDLLKQDLNQAEAKVEAVRAEVGRWADAYAPSIITYPSRDEVRAINETPEFAIGRNAMMQLIHDTLLPRILAALATEEGSR